MKLERYDSEQIELFIDLDNKGYSYASCRGYSRMSGVHMETIGKRISELPSDRKKQVTKAEIPTKQGKRIGRLLSEDIIAETNKLPILYQMLNNEGSQISTDYQYYDGNFLIDTKTGEAAACQSGIARLLSSPCSTVQSFLKQNDLEGKDVKIPTNSGIQAAKVYDEKTIAKCIRHFGTEQQKEEMDICSVRVLIHKAAGYQITSTATEKQEKIEPAFV